MDFTMPNTVQNGVFNHWFFFVIFVFSHMCNYLNCFLFFCPIFS